MTGLPGSDAGVRWGYCSRKRGIHRREKEGKLGCRAAGTQGKDRDQPFSFTVGDSGNLWGGITCKRVDMIFISLV